MMRPSAKPRLLSALRGMAALARRPEVFAILPAVAVGAFWIGGETGLTALAVATPVIFVLAEWLFPIGRDAQGEAHITTEPARRGQIVSFLDQILRNQLLSRRSTACFVLSLDNEARLIERHGRSAQTEILDRIWQRLISALREGDMVAQLEGGSFAVALGPLRRVDLETAIQLAGRMQSAVAAPISLDATRVYVSASIGFCIAQRAPEQTGLALLQAAQIASDVAAGHGTGSIRAFQPDMARHRADRDASREELARALEEGQFQAYFQPQVSTHTATITGFEALARWIHPQRGPIPPSEFLPLVQEFGLSDLLSEVMLRHALTALRAWDEAGHRIGTVAVNFSESELQDPKLVERLKWELDRFHLSAQRLTVEILETVVANTNNDVIARNIAALSALGCGIDLDDFGTGHASITSIRRFAVRRLKIDRSFVARLGEDPEQQKMVAAILSMAEQLGLDTLAEGIESEAEHAILAQLGCGHVQGFGIGRPMPFDQTQDWITSFRARRGGVLRIGAKAR